jgi:hypothetical protein
MALILAAVEYFCLCACAHFYHHRCDSLLTGNVAIHFAVQRDLLEFCFSARCVNVHGRPLDLRSFANALHGEPVI